MTLASDQNNSTNRPRQRVVVVGGGISGLAAAHRIWELQPEWDITLLEAAERLGGVLKTVPQDDFLFEESADNFITTLPATTNLCKRLGLADELLNTNDEHRRAFVVCRGQLQPIPPGFIIMAPKKVWPMLTTPILSLRGKLRMLAEYCIKRKPELSDESLAAFATRRFGKETFERLIQPLVGGIYTADPEKLSLLATLPRFLEMEQKYGSLVRGALKESHQAQPGAANSGARYSMFTTLKAGMSRLVERIAQCLPEGTIALNSPVGGISRNAQGDWNIDITGSSPRKIAADAVIVAAPAHKAAVMLQNENDQLAEELSGIPYAGCAIVSLGCRRNQIEHPLNGFGFVVPQIEQLNILSASFTSIKYDGRAPEDTVLIRVFIGGACQPELVGLSDEELLKIAKNDLGRLIGLSGEPIACHINRYQAAMPQYHLGHCNRVQRIEQLVAELPGLRLAGNAYSGVGIPQCIASGEQAAEKIVADYSQFQAPG